jgi:Myb-like DNA-binding domain
MAKDSTNELTLVPAAATPVAIGKEDTNEKAEAAAAVAAEVPSTAKKNGSKAASRKKASSKLVVPPGLPHLPTTYGGYPPHPHMLPYNPHMFPHGHPAHHHMQMFRPPQNPGTTTATNTTEGNTNPTKGQTQLPSHPMHGAQPYPPPPPGYRYGPPPPYSMQGHGHPQYYPPPGYHAYGAPTGPRPPNASSGKTKKPAPQKSSDSAKLNAPKMDSNGSNAACMPLAHLPPNIYGAMPPAYPYGIQPNAAMSQPASFRTEAKTAENDENAENRSIKDTELIVANDPVKQESETATAPNDWTKDEDEALWDLAVHHYGPIDQWESIAGRIALLPRAPRPRTQAECVARFDMLSQSTKSHVNRPWTVAEDVRVSELVKQLGTRNWTKVAKFIPGRTCKSIRERYQSALTPALASSKGRWTTEEDRIILKTHAAVGSKWAVIAKNLKGR